MDILYINLNMKDLELNAIVVIKIIVMVKFKNVVSMVLEMNMIIK